MADINYVAVVVAAVASMALGYLWYGPLFGKLWMGMMHITPKDMKNMKMKPGVAMSLGFVGTLVTAYVLARFVDMLSIVAWQDAIQFAAMAWLGLVAPVQFGIVLWENKPAKLFLLNTAHTLVSLIVMSTILAVWA